MIVGRLEIYTFIILITRYGFGSIRIWVKHLYQKIIHLMRIQQMGNASLRSYLQKLHKYWISWILIFLSFPLAYLPKIIRSFLGSMLGKMLFQFNTSKKEIIKINLKKTFKN